MDEKDIKCGYSTIVKINREVEALKAKVAKLEHGEVDSEEVLENMTVVRLKAYADSAGIDLGPNTLKGDIIKAIEAAQAES